MLKTTNPQVLMAIMKLSVESLEGEWNEVRNPSKPIQEIDTLIGGDSIIKDIKPSLMSASNMIRKAIPSWYKS